MPITQPDPHLVRDAIILSGLPASRFAVLVCWRDARTIRRWLAGSAVPALVRRRLQHFVGLAPVHRVALIHAVTEPAEARDAQL